MNIALDFSQIIRCLYDACICIVYICLISNIKSFFFGNKSFLLLGKKEEKRRYYVYRKIEATKFRRKKGSLVYITQQEIYDRLIYIGNHQYHFGSRLPDAGFTPEIFESHSSYILIIYKEKKKSYSRRAARLILRLYANNIG